MAASTKEYHVEVRVKNNWFLKKMHAAGFENASQLARASGVPPVAIGQFINLKKSGMNAWDGWRKQLIRISETLRCLPEDLIPPKHLKSALARNKSAFEVSAQDVERLVYHTPETPEGALIKAEAEKVLADALAILSPREERVLRLRYGLDGCGERTLGDVAKAFDVTAARIRQIEQRALRQLKHPSRQRQLRYYSAEDVA